MPSSRYVTRPLSTADQHATPSAALEVARDALRRTNGMLATSTRVDPPSPSETYRALGLLTQCVTAVDGVLEGFGCAILEQAGAVPDRNPPLAQDPPHMLTSATAVMALARASELCAALQLSIENAHIAISGSAGPVHQASGPDRSQERQPNHEVV